MDSAPGRLAAGGIGPAAGPERPAADACSRPAGERYCVFGRPRPGERLQLIGTLRASTPELAYLYARMNYQERNWSSLAVAPQAAFHGDVGDAL